MYCRAGFVRVSVCVCVCVCVCADPLPQVQLPSWIIQLEGSAVFLWQMAHSCLPSEHISLSIYLVLSIAKKTLMYTQFLQVHKSKVDDVRTLSRRKIK